MNSPEEAALRPAAGETSGVLLGTDYRGYGAIDETGHRSTHRLNAYGAVNLPSISICGKVWSGPKSLGFAVKIERSQNRVQIPDKKPEAGCLGFGNGELWPHAARSGAARSDGSAESSTSTSSAWHSARYLRTRANASCQRGLSLTGATNRRMPA